MSEIRRATKLLIEDILRDYPEIDEHIKNKREELMYPISDEDDNIGGGKSSKISKPQEQLIIRIDEDEELTQLRRQRDVITECFRLADQDTQTLISELYFKKHPQYTVDGLIAQKKIYCGWTKAHRLINNFINEVAKGLKLNRV